MRRILIEKPAARAGEAGRRPAPRWTPTSTSSEAGGPDDELVALHEALEQFAAHDPLKAQLVELRSSPACPGQAAECLHPLAVHRRARLALRPRLAVRSHGRRGFRKKVTPA